MAAVRGSGAKAVAGLRRGGPSTLELPPATPRDDSLSLDTFCACLEPLMDTRLSYLEASTLFFNFAAPLAGSSAEAKGELVDASSHVLVYASFRSALVEAAFLKLAAESHPQELFLRRLLAAHDVQEDADMRCGSPIKRVEEAAPDSDSDLAMTEEALVAEAERRAALLRGDDEEATASSSSAAKDSSKSSREARSEKDAKESESGSEEKTSEKAGNAGLNLCTLPLLQTLFDFDPDLRSLFLRCMRGSRDAEEELTWGTLAERNAQLALPQLQRWAHAASLAPALLSEETLEKLFHRYSSKPDASPSSASTSEAVHEDGKRTTDGEDGITQLHSSLHDSTGLTYSAFLRLLTHCAAVVFKADLRRALDSGQQPPPMEELLEQMLARLGLRKRRTVAEQRSAVDTTELRRAHDDRITSLLGDLRSSMARTALPARPKLRPGSAPPRRLPSTAQPPCLVRETVAFPPLPRTVAHLLDAALLCHNTSQYERARCGYDDARAVFLETAAAEDELTRTIFDVCYLNAIGSVHESEGDDVEALAAYMDAKRCALRLPEEHMSVALSYSSIGSVCYHLRCYELGLQCFAHAKALHMGSTPLRLMVAGLNNNLASCFQQLGRTEEALFHFEQAARAMCGPFRLHPRALMIRRNLEAARSTSCRLGMRRSVRPLGLRRRPDDGKLIHSKTGAFRIDAIDLPSNWRLKIKDAKGGKKKRRKKGGKKKKTKKKKKKRKKKAA
eukprot:PLAT752.1.p1 GENE.PLAT752.1~~PLAT752.1.p1  ORF type:complete len:778 (-),score=242.25 PLAT752.1:772-2967(-)